MARATKNSTVVAFMRVLIGQLALARELVLHGPFDPQWAVRAHERTLGAVLSGDPDAIDAAMDEPPVWRRARGRAAEHTAKRGDPGRVLRGVPSERDAQTADLSQLRGPPSRAARPSGVRQASERCVVLAYSMHMMSRKRASQ